MGQLVRGWPEQTSSWEFIKMHLTLHFVACILRGGVPAEYCSGLFEHLHTTLVKQAYRRTNKKDATGQIWRRSERRRALHSAFSDIPLARDYETISRRVSTLFLFSCKVPHRLFRYLNAFSSVRLTTSYILHVG
jgi:hypothetical protein